MPARKTRVLPPQYDDPTDDLVNMLRTGAVTGDELRVLVEQKDDATKNFVERLIGEHTTLAWRADPLSMAEFLTDGRIHTRWAYQRILSAKFTQLMLDHPNRSKRQQWWLPSRYGKSTIGARVGPLWNYDRFPQAALIITSYGDELPTDHALWIRDMLRTHHRELATQLKRDRQTMNRFLTDAGGGLLAKGMYSGVMGFGCNEFGGLIADDMLRSWQDAHSPTKRLRAMETYTGTLRSRLDTEDAYILVIGQRLHKKDPLGQLKDAAEQGTGEEWDITVMPEICTSVDDVLGRELGDVLEEERFNDNEVRAKHIALTEYVAAAVCQQDPQDEAGNEIKRDWFVLDETMPEQYDETCASWDLKLKDTESGDFVAGQAWGRVGADYFFFDQLRGQWDHPTTQNAMALMQVRHPEITTHYVEAAGSAKEVVGELRKPQPDYEISEEMRGVLQCTEEEARAVELIRRRGMSGLIFNSVTEGTKPVRARMYIAPAAEPGHVHLPAFAQFTPVFLAEVSAFPQGEYDDQVDAASQALKKLGVGDAVVAATTRKVGSPAPGAARSASPVAGGGSASAAASTRTIGRRR